MPKELAYAMVKKEIKCIQPGKEKINSPYKIYNKQTPRTYMNQKGFKMQDKHLKHKIMFLCTSSEHGDQS